MLPINGWLERQKKYTGDASTHTWQNHLDWYQKRRKDGVVWLMRRATRALTQEVTLLQASQDCLHYGHKAKAVTFLLECGSKALGALDKRALAKKAVLARCMHARRVMIKQDDAHVFLKEMANKVVQVSLSLSLSLGLG